MCVWACVRACVRMSECGHAGGWGCVCLETLGFPYLVATHNLTTVPESKLEPFPSIPTKAHRASCRSFKQSVIERKTALKSA